MRQDEANDCGSNLLSCHKALCKVKDKVLHLSLIVHIRVDVCDFLLPRGKLVQHLLVLFVENSVGRLLLEQWLEDVAQEGVLLLFKVHILNLLKHALASHFCYQEGLSRATDLKSDFSRVFVVADHEVLLDHDFRACVPIRVAGDSLLGQNFFLVGLMVHLFLLGFWLLRGRLPGRGLTLTA